MDAPKPNAKACLISGPCGVGKSLTAKLMAKEMGYETMHMNASDTRNKKSIEATVKELSTNVTFGFFQPKSKEVKSKKSIIIMDEIDGVGMNDRGGIAAIINIIKETKTPVICICNDRFNQKLKTLVNYCFDVKF